MEVLEKAGKISPNGLKDVKKGFRGRFENRPPAGGRPGPPDNDASKDLKYLGKCAVGLGYSLYYWWC